MASKGVMAVELAHDSIAGVFHFSIDENVSGEQSHFSTHVHPIYDLSSMVILWLPWAEEKSRFMLQQYPQFNNKYSTKLDKTWITWCDYNWNLQQTNSTTDSRKEHLGDLNFSKGECVLVSNSCVSWIAQIPTVKSHSSILPCSNKQCFQSVLKFQWTS